jgi:hypothetical protein
MTSRRGFIKTSAIGGAVLTGGLYLPDVFGEILSPVEPDLYQLSNTLLQQLATALINLQVTDKTRTDDYGGIWCPADKAVHGRVGDTIYPFFYLASKTNNSKYIDAAVMLFRWMEQRVSQPDGSWLNEPVKGSWKGTTVFAAIAMAEALRHHSTLMDTASRNELTARLKKAGDYICTNVNIEYGNINYPVTASYGLSLLGELLDEPKFKTRGREMAHQSLQYISKDGLLFGEGDITGTSKKGCVSVDLGYNVEESLPALVLYGKLTGDTEVLDAVTHAMQAHMQFMLPDGGWDNSWGTRNYKWTYWGSRTSDGCQSAYALMAARDERFYKVALRSTQLMQQCTVNGLLQGGPHNASHQVTPCVHHTFAHIKALTNVLEYGDIKLKPPLRRITLPREEVYGSRFFADIQTWLIAKGKFKATVTGYDRDYKSTKNGHATGGALCMLWHAKTGPLLCASMNDYQIFEAGNQQADTDPLSMPLTPRIELKLDSTTYTNISDQSAIIEVVNEAGSVVVNTHSKLVDKDQQSPPSGDINCHVSYVFTDAKVILKFSFDNSAHDAKVFTIIPLISKNTEKISFIDDSNVHISKPSATVKLLTNHPIAQMPITGKRLFNFVPGFEAVPFSVKGSDVVVELEVV